MSFDPNAPRLEFPLAGDNAVVIMLRRKVTPKEWMQVKDVFALAAKAFLVDSEDPSPTVEPPASSEPPVSPEPVRVSPEPVRVRAKPGPKPRVVAIETVVRETAEVVTSEPMDKVRATGHVVQGSDPPPGDFVGRGRRRRDATDVSGLHDLHETETFIMVPPHDMGVTATLRAVFKANPRQLDWTVQQVLRAVGHAIPDAKVRKSLENLVTHGWAERVAPGVYHPLASPTRQAREHQDESLEEERSAPA